jgi:hypothetical protein
MGDRPWAEWKGRGFVGSLLKCEPVASAGQADCGLRIGSLFAEVTIVAVRGTPSSYLTSQKWSQPRNKCCEVASRGVLRCEKKACDRKLVQQGLAAS